MISTLAEPANARHLLDSSTTLLNGQNAAPTTARRHRMVLANAMDYAMELKLLDGNPIRQLKWKAPKISGGIDRRCVVNPRQARALLEAVRGQQPSGPCSWRSSASCTTRGCGQRRPSTCARTT
jgi:hypothetical protein